MAASARLARAPLRFKGAHAALHHEATSDVPQEGFEPSTLRWSGAESRIRRSLCQLSYWGVMAECRGLAPHALRHDRLSGPSGALARLPLRKSTGMTAGAVDAVGHPPSVLVPWESARDRIRTCTGGALDAVPLLLGYTSGIGTARGSCTPNLRILSPAPLLVGLPRQIQ